MQEWHEPTAASRRPYSRCRDVFLIGLLRVFSFPGCNPMDSEGMQDLYEVASSEIIYAQILSLAFSNFCKNYYAWIQLREVAPDIGLPNTRSMHFIWVDSIIYMQY